MNKATERHTATNMQHEKDKGTVKNKNSKKKPNKREMHIITACMVVQAVA